MPRFDIAISGPIHSSFLKSNSAKRLATILIWGVSFSSLAQATLPIASIKGVDELFNAKSKIYSPLNGMMAFGTVSERGSEGQPAFSPLEDALFQKVASEVIPTHVAKLPATHLVPSTLARILIAYSEYHSKVIAQTASLADFEKTLMDSIATDEGYLTSLGQAQVNIDQAKKDLDQFLTDMPAREKPYKDYMEQVVAPKKVSVAKIQNDFKKKRPEALSKEEVEKAKEEMKQVNKKADELLAAFHAGGKKADAEKAYNKVVSSNDVKGKEYSDKLNDLVKNLASSFHQDIVAGRSTVENHRTVTTLLSYLWMRGSEKKDLKGYIETLSQRGFLVPQASYLPENFYQDHFTDEDYKKIGQKFTKAWFKRNFVRDHYGSTVAFSADSSAGSSDKKVPELLSFDYFKWMRYNSSYPDCVENAVHNLFYILAYNPKTGLPDAEILETLKAKHYRNLDPRVIQFFRDYKTVDDHRTGKASLEWLSMMKHLNVGLDHLKADEKVDYLGSNEVELAGPYSNVVRTMNRLVGYHDDINTDHMAAIFAKTHEVSGIEITYRNELEDGKIGRTASFRVGDGTFVFKSLAGRQHVTYNLYKDNTDQAVSKIVNIISTKAGHKKADAGKRLRYHLGAQFLQKKFAVSTGNAPE